MDYETTTEAEPFAAQGEPESKFTRKVADKFTEAQTRARTFVRQNPVSTLLGAVAVGFIIGYALHRPERTWRDRYIGEPTGKLKDWFASAADTTSEGLGDLKDRTASMASAAASAVRKGVGRLKFW
jgi:hypothetical protein